MTRSFVLHKVENFHCHVQETSRVKYKKQNTEEGLETSSILKRLLFFNRTNRTNIRKVTENDVE